MNNWFPIISLVILIPSFLSIIFTPYWTRKTESFGVTIPQKIYNSPELKKLRKKFALYTGILAMTIIVILFLISTDVTEYVAGIQLSGAIILFLILSSIIYLKFHFTMKTLKENSNWQKEKNQQLFISTSFHKEKLTYSNLWFLISFVLTFIGAFFTLKYYHLLPEQIPMQYNFSGEITNWAEKSYRSVLMLPVTQLYLTLLFIFVNAMIARSKQQIDSENPEESLKRNTLFRKRWSLFTIITGNALAVLFAFIQLSFFIEMAPFIMMAVTLGFSLLIIFGAIYLAYTTGQGGSRIKNGTITTDGKSINRDDDRHWKFGIFYVNREDPALFLEKRFGVGWTINLARPLAWILFLGIIASAIVIPLLLS